MYGCGHRYSQLFGRGAPEEVNRCDDSGRFLLFQNGIRLISRRTVATEASD